ncbi:Dispersed gene family protein 1 [Trypanosoma melophagium]|uniref:Dispersed gene family protein 1 n=1 Tax=Trypanosoma melophagium TaxID=715481 RepID=UPI003519F89A|nr:Dispersed gene family protein 1 [Trypanosoma melophagium]
MPNTSRILFDRSPSGLFPWSMSLTRFTVLMLVLAVVSVFIPTADAIPFRLRGVTLDKSITIGRAVDKVLLDEVNITAGVELVFDISAMVPTDLHIELKNCVCQGGSQIQVRGYDKEVDTTEKKLKVDINRLSGDLCSLVFAHHMPPNTKVTIRDSTIMATTPVKNGDENAGEGEQRGKTPATGRPPLVLDTLTLTKGELRLENTVLRTTLNAGSAMQMDGNVKLIKSALVLDGVLLEVSSPGDGHALYVSPSSVLSLQEHSVFSLTNTSILSTGKGVFLGNEFTLTKSILRLVLVDGRVVSGPVLDFGSKSVFAAGGWLDLNNVMAAGDASTTSIASLAQVTVDGGVVAIARSAAVGATLVAGPHVKCGKITAQCNRVGGKLLQSAAEYHNAGLAAVHVESCESCAAELSCYAPLTSFMSNCACQCSSGGVGPACLPMNVPLAKAAITEKDCMKGVAVTKSMVVGQGLSNVCFEAVVFSGPIIVTVDLRSMNTLAKTLNVTLQRCMLTGGAQLRIRGFDKSVAAMMPRVSLGVTKMKSTEGTIVLQGSLPERSSVLLADSTLSSTVNESKYVITSSGNKGTKYSPVLVLDSVNLVSTNFVLTRTTMMCGGSTCAVILVEHGLSLQKKSAFYMDNCGINAAGNVMNFMSSKLSILGQSVFSIRNSSWRMKSDAAGNAWECEEIELKGDSVLEMTGNKMSVPKSIFNMNALQVDGNNWLLQRENEFQCQQVFNAENVEFKGDNVWSVIRNKFLKPSGMRYYGGGDMFNQRPSEEGLTVYGVCNYRFGGPVSDYTRLNLPSNVQVVECGGCSASTECFKGKTLSAAGDDATREGEGECKCKCASGGHGDICLPVIIPESLGPRPLREAGAVDIPCVSGGSVSTIAPPVLGASGMCFIGVNFTSPIVIDLSAFRPTRKTVNITFARCTMSGVSLTGVKDYAVHLSMSTSTITDGKFVIGGVFGPESHIQLVDSAIDTTDAEAFVIEENTNLGLGSKILVLRTNIVARKSAIYFKQGFTLDASGFIVQNSRLEAALPQSPSAAALHVYSLQIKNDGYLSVVDTEMIAGNGVWLAQESVMNSSGRFVLARNTLKGHGSVSGTALFHRESGLKLSGGSTVRVMLNKVEGASIYYAKAEFSGSLSLSEEGTAIIFSGNDMGGVVPAFHTAHTVVDSSAKLVGVCNKRNGGVVKLNELFAKSTVTDIDCGSCSEEMKCHMPGKNGEPKSGSCSCSLSVGGDNKQCPSCLPYEIPEINVIPALTEPVDRDTTCIKNQTLTELSLNMQKTHHCYIGVTFSGEKAVAKFVFRRMPLQYPINITFSGCTFRGGAALHFVGSHDAVNSAGVWINIRRTVLLSSVVSFSNALPKGSDIVVREIDSVQTSWIKTPDDFSNSWSVVAMKDLILSGSSILLVSDASAYHKEASRYSLRSGDGILSGGSLTLLDGSSLYVQHCTFSRFNNMIKLDGPVNIDERSAMAFLENKIVSGNYIMHSKEVMVRNLGVFRLVENVALNSGQGVYMYKGWDLYNSSWIDWRGNDISSGELLHIVPKAGVSIDSSSMLTFIGNSKSTATLKKPLLKSTENGYKFFLGCVNLAQDTNLLNFHGVTDEVQCDRCLGKGNCFTPLTGSSNGCSCKCSDGGQGDVCVPGRVAVPLLLPPLPSPPVAGECINDVEYPEVAQTLGKGLSSLCYRNVTFSGAFMRLTVDVRAMTGDSVNITFDGCKWLRGAALILLGGNDGDSNAGNPARSTNIAITGNTFHEGLLSPFGSFPSRTNIIASGNHFNVTRIIAVSDVVTVQRSCIATNKLNLRDHSAFKLIDNSFIISGTGSNVVFAGAGGMTVQSHSVFAMVGNKFTVTDLGNAALHVLGDDPVKAALEVKDNSVVVIEKSRVSGVLEHFVSLSGLKTTGNSALLLENNDGLMVNYILNIKESINMEAAWLRMHRNAAYNVSATVFHVGSEVNMKGSHIVLSGNSVSPVNGKGTPAIAKFIKYRTHNFEGDSSLVFACNVLDGELVEYKESLEGAKVDNLECGDKSCTLEASCFPMLSSSILASNCTCACRDGGHGDRCLPVVVVPKLPDEDPCVRDMNISWEVRAGFKKSSICYVGVNFTADVLVDLTAMSGNVRNVTLVNCTMAGSASLYILGWESEPPADRRAEVWISGLVARSSSGGVMLANKFPSGSHITMVDSMLVAEEPIPYPAKYNLDDASASLVLYNLDLTGTVLTIARTQVISAIPGVAGVLAKGAVKLSSGSAVYMERLWVQAALQSCVSLEGEVTARDGSVFAFIDSDFLLCGNAVSVRHNMNVVGSVVKFVRNNFVLLSDHALMFDSTLILTEGSMLLMKANTHDSSEKEMLHADGAIKVSGSTLSFVRNQGLSPRMLSANSLTVDDGHVRVSCNTVGGNKLTKAAEYTVAGFGSDVPIEIVGCDTCDKGAYCYAFGTTSSTEANGECVCTCGNNGHGEVCAPVEGVTLPPVPSPQSSSFLLENATVDSMVVVTRGMSEVILRDLVMEEVQTVIYVPWMAKGSLRILLQNISLRNGAVLYIVGGSGIRRTLTLDDNQRVDLSVCGVETFNGVITLAGTFPEDSVLTITNSLLITTEVTPLVYLPGTTAEPHAPALLLWNLHLERSVMVFREVALLSMVTGGQALVAGGSLLQLANSGIALDKVELGGDCAVHVYAKTSLSTGALLRLSESKVYGERGLVFEQGISTDASAVVIGDSTGTLRNGALLVLHGKVSFLSGSWLALRGNKITGKLLSLPPEANGAEFMHSTLTMHGNTGTSSAIMDGAVASQSTGLKFVVGCTKHNGRTLTSTADYASAGIVGSTHIEGCDTCNADVKCFAGGTTSMSSCSCECKKNGYGNSCLPVHVPRPVGCNSTVACPALKITTLLGRQLSLNDIRNGGKAATSSEGVTRLMVKLPPPFRWANDAEKNVQAKFELGSPEQQNGYQGPWGALLRNATWKRNASSPESVLELAIPGHADYFVGVDEMIHLQYGPSALHGGCMGDVRGSFVITSSTPEELREALFFFTGIGVTASTVAVGAAAGLASVAEAQMLGVFRTMSCASAHERVSLSILQYFLSPFAGFGFMWMVVGNMLIIAVFGCAHYALATLFGRLRELGTESAWSAMRFPSITYLLAYLLHPGIAVGSAFTLATSEAEVHHYVVGVIGALYSVTFLVGVCYFVVRRSKAEFLPYDAFANKPFFVRWLYPSGYWCPSTRQRMYGAMFMGVRGAYGYMCVFQLTVLCIVGVMAAIRPPASKCHIVYIAMATVLFTGAIVIAFTNMMRTVFLTVMYTLGCALLGLLCVTNAVNVVAPSDAGLRLFSAIVFLLTVVLLTAAVYSLLLCWVESRRWQALRTRSDKHPITTTTTGGNTTMSGSDGNLKEKLGEGGEGEGSATTPTEPIV